MFRNRNGVLRSIYSETRILLDIQAAVKAVLPADFHVAALKDGELHLVTRSAAIATRIKYSQKSILGALRTQKLPQLVKSIKVSVRPEQVSAPIPAPEALPPSPENARQLQSAAEFIEDPELKSALIKLSNRSQDTD
jgi:hypothetical protein